MMRALAFALTLLFACPAHSAGDPEMAKWCLAHPPKDREPLCNAGPDLCALPACEGEIVPFDGQLLTPQLAADLGTKAARCDERVAEVTLFQEKLTTLALIGPASKVEVAEAEAAFWKTRYLGAQAELTPPWYERPAPVIVVTVTVVVGLMWGIGQVAQSTGR